MFVINYPYLKISFIPVYYQKENAQWNFYYYKKTMANDSQHRIIETIINGKKFIFVLKQTFKLIMRTLSILHYSLLSKINWTFFMKSKLHFSELAVKKKIDQKSNQF